MLELADLTIDETKVVQKVELTLTLMIWAGVSPRVGV